MIIDAIMYDGEPIFDLRYEILKDTVDKFIVCEFDRTFSGLKKDPHPIVKPKVDYFFLTDIKDFKPNLQEAFAREYNQREALKTVIEAKDDDIVVFGDCDEVWKPFAISDPIKLKLRVYAYWLDNRSNEDFALGPVAGKWKDLKDKSFNGLRKGLPLTQEYCGWHFTNMGGVERIRHKIESYGHQEFNTAQIKEMLEQRIKNNQDYIGRPYGFWTDESNWPQYLKDHRKDHESYLRSPVL